MPGPWGHAIELLRKSKGLTRDRAAKRAKMTATTFGRIERGQHTQTQKLQAIADAFGVNIDEVLHKDLLRGEAVTGNTTLPSGAQLQNGPYRPVQIDPSAAVADLQTQVHVLQQQLAAIVAEQEIRNRRRRKRLSIARERKQKRTKDARKPRKTNAG
jgi:transcriptional regulator with XRE-family HTH domain